MLQLYTNSLQNISFLKIHARKYSGQLVVFMLGAEQRVQRAEQGMQRAELRMQRAELRMQRAELRMQRAEHRKAKS
jgi:hypothetical protein